ncbi:hypothetical protein PHET_00439 [Paragonimus heterotremus]|uniref:Uncharacterized protein n=1 Tax=Paragonimus heterotremus TaxID=100268 RepID=A0A8J4TNN8_9TREM|nr:hypothetical protein PHET_00439 [Paragonimus heterotremus]
MGPDNFFEKHQHSSLTVKDRVLNLNEAKRFVKLTRTGTYFQVLFRFYRLPSAGKTARAILKALDTMLSHIPGDATR